MNFNWDVPAQEEIIVALENPSYSDISIYDSYVQSLPTEQYSEFLDPSLLSNPEWTNAAFDYPTPGQEPRTDLPSKREEPTASTAEDPCLSSEHPDEADWRTAIRAVEKRFEKRQESIEKRLDEVEDMVKGLQTGYVLSSW